MNSMVLQYDRPFYFHTVDKITIENALESLCALHVPWTESDLSKQVIMVLLPYHYIIWH